jgi:hypothetical protein
MHIGSGGENHIRRLFHANFFLNIVEEKSCKAVFNSIKEDGQHLLDLLLFLLKSALVNSNLGGLHYFEAFPFAVGSKHSLGGVLRGGRINDNDILWILGGFGHTFLLDGSLHDSAALCVARTITNQQGHFPKTFSICTEF